MRWQASRWLPSSASVERPGHHRADPTGQVDPLAGLFGPGGREEVVGLAVVPAAVAAPHVADQELGVVVDGSQVRLVGQVGRDGHLVDDPVERARPGS